MNETQAMLDKVVDSHAEIRADRDSLRQRAEAAEALAAMLSDGYQPKWLEKAAPLAQLAAAVLRDVLAYLEYREEMGLHEVEYDPDDVEQRMLKNALAYRDAQAGPAGEGGK